MRNQGCFRPYPKEITKVVTVEGKTICMVRALGFWGGTLVITEESWVEIGKLMGWKP